MKKRCFYHAGCPDGFGAAWSVRQAWGDDAWYVARSHEDHVRMADCEDALVAFVDIAPAADELRELADCAAQVMIIDHHVTARDRLASDPSQVNEYEADGHVLHFDLGHSGAVLAWQTFHPDADTPELLRYVEDQDLWNWALPDSDAVNAAIASVRRVSASSSSTDSRSLSASIVRAASTDSATGCSSTRGFSTSSKKVESSWRE